MAYKAPIWEDGNSPAISAENLNALSQAAEGAQVLYGNSAPTSSTEGAVGQFYLVVVADANGNYALYQCVGISGSAYNWELLGTTPAYAKVSNPVAQTLRIPSGSSVEFALISNFAPIKIASYETAGSYQWTAPDLANGKGYKIGVLVIGAGASGCSDTTGTGANQKNYCPGGASGFSRAISKEVSPGEVIALVVGAGGAKVTGATRGKSGGASSFGGITALGGVGQAVIQEPNSTLDFICSFGACPGYIGNGVFGMDRSSVEPSINLYDSFYGIPAQCFNPFEQKEILASGGGAYTYKLDNGSAGVGGKNPLTGKGGGDGAYSISGNATATAATEPGCGGGSASAKGTPTSGAGADGAVYIYFLGVSDE